MIGAFKGEYSLMRSKMIVAAGLLVGAATCLSAEQSKAESATTGAMVSTVAQDAIAFGSRESARQMDLSPDGSKVVFVGPGPGPSTVVYVANLGDGSSKGILAAKGDPERLSWCAWVSNARLVCSYGANMVEDGVPVGFTRLISLNADGSDIKQIGNKYAYQFDGAILDWLPGDGENVLMSRGGVVSKVNVTTLRSSEVERGRNAAASYMTDGRGNVRLMAIHQTQLDGQLTTGKQKYSYRTADSRDWHDLTEYMEDEFVPLAIDASTDSLYALYKTNGRYSLFSIKLDGTLARTKVASNPTVDIDAVVRSGDGQRVIGYTYAEEKRHTVYFDKEYQALRASLAKALPSSPLINFVSTSADGQKVLLFAGSDRDPGRYYLFDKTKKSLGEVLVDRPQLSGRELAPVKSVTYKVADGTSIPAYLTLPVGKPATGLPAIVIPHGGPSSRDEWGFDWIAQFFVARGYAVIQPNYRGSAGYGDQWLNDNGFKGWRTSIGDVNAAAHYLAGSGIADPNRIAIVGWSYGGYAALQAAATEPGLYKSVAAIAPVTDLALLKRDADKFTNKKEVAKFVGTGPHLVEGSPTNHAGQIKGPVLLVHGDLDTNVFIRHSDEMEEQLRKAGVKVEYLRYKGLDHQLADSQVRAQMLAKIAVQLSNTIGK
jgi:dipeptidyl aminopeptidase/acylaminoacyl peptidase